jgi:glycosyltransferase involved in cell wall biosynthesis
MDGYMDYSDGADRIIIISKNYQKKIKMKIAFVSTENINDKNLWSGTVFCIYQNLVKKFDNIIVFRASSNTFIFLKILFSGITYLSKRIAGKQSLNLYYSFIHPISMAKRVDRFIKKNPVDCIISTTNEPFIYTRNKVPLVIITDATVKLLYHEYSKGKGWSGLFYRILEKNAFKVTNKAFLIVSSSTDTARSLMNDYNVPPEKIATIPFGANIDYTGIQIPPRIINKEKQINFLFIGKDWKRKGGNFTVSVCDELSKQGFNISLTIVGCKMPENCYRSYIRNYIYLDKNRPDNYFFLVSLFKEAHFFMVFSEAEMYGVVFCEAAAYGLPSVTFAVGGIVDIVINDQTGIILPKDSKAEDFALKITDLVSDQDKYKAMSENARNRYEKLLNWDVFTDSLKKEINKRIK